jgi:MFS family permease
MSWLRGLGRSFMNRIPRRLRPLLLAPEGAPAPQQDAELRRNLHLVAVHGIFNSAAISMVGPFAAIFAMKIGATRLHVALLTSAPAIVSLLAMIPGARTIDRSDRKMHLTARFMLANRTFYLALACVPFFPGPARATAFVTLLALMNLPGAISNVAWQAFAARIVPPEHRATTFAARNRLMSLVGTSLTLGMGLFLDRMVFPLGYQIAFVAAFVVAVAEILVFSRMHEPAESREGLPVPRSPASPPLGSSDPPFASAPRMPIFAFWARQSRSAVGGIKAILRERRFVRYTLVSMLFYLAWQIPWPLFSWYQVRVLHANNVWVSLLALLNTGGALVGYSFWSRFINRWGNLRALFAATLPIFTTCVVYAFSSQLYTIAAANLLVGAIFSGVNIALFNTLLEMTPEAQKTSYIAYFNTAVTVSAIIAPLLGVSLLELMSFRAAFLVTAAIRIAGSLCYYALYRTEKREAAKGARG